MKDFILKLNGKMIQEPFFRLDNHNFPTHDPDGPKKEVALQRALHVIYRQEFGEGIGRVVELCLGV